MTEEVEKGGDATSTVVLVEGLSDKFALEALAARRGADLDAGGIRVVDMGGSKNFGTFVHRYGPPGLNVGVAGLYDAAEADDVRRALARAGIGSELTRSDLERLGFYGCVADLEDELIRALGPTRVEGVLDAMGSLGSFRTMQKQPEWRGRRAEEQLRRFLGAHATMKIRAAPMLVEALEPDEVPRPLVAVLAHVGV